MLADAYEQARLREVERLLSQVWLWYSGFVCALVLVAANKLHTPPWLSYMYSLATMMYAWLRYRLTCTPTVTQNLPSIIDVADMLLICVGTHVTGGLKSFLNVAFSLPVLGVTLKYGLRGTVSGIFFGGMCVTFNILSKQSKYSFDPIYHLLSVLGTLLAACYIVTTLIEREKNLRAELVKSSMIDPLTGLYNISYLRRFAGDEIERTCSTDEKCSLVFLDIDSFKLINDTYGHLAGDCILKQVANLLEQQARTYDLVARYGGDEFVIFMPGADPEETEQAVCHILECFDHTYFWVPGNSTVHVSVSIGTAICPEDGNTFDGLLAVAEERMYVAKANHKTLWNSNGDPAQLYDLSRRKVSEK